MIYDKTQQSIIDAIDRLNRPYRQAASTINDAMRTTELAYQSFNKTIANYQHILNAARVASANALAAHESLLSLANKYSFTLKYIFDLATSIRKTNERVDSLLNTFDSSLQLLRQAQTNNLLNPLFNALDSAIYSIDKSDVINSNAKRHDLLDEEIVQLDKFVKHVSTDVDDGTQFVHKLIAALRNLISIKNGALISLVIHVLISYAVNLTTPDVKNFIQSSGQNKSLIVRAIKKRTREHFPASELNEYCFVIVDVLNVRRTPSTKSCIIEVIYLGKCLKLIAKGRHWSRIQYFNESNELVDGWVFSRYIEKFH